MKLLAQVTKFASIVPEKVAISVAGRAALTYNDLLSQSANLAEKLVGLGVKRGDRVAFLCQPGPDYVVRFAAA
jgi:acyl-CoA synthetase (AMP-forming)/AMP-acid ligase II